MIVQHRLMRDKLFTRAMSITNDQYSSARRLIWT